MQFSTTSFAVLALAATVSAHMNMYDPTPLKYKGNPNAKTVDDDIKSPNTASTFPCKGALDVFDTDEGASVATWAAGSQQTIKIEGGAAHDGGSCQASLSYNSGANWTVIYSKEGDCPTTPELDFTVPSDTPAGDKVLLAWSWVNHTGNREYYMNCASITITAASSKKRDEEEIEEEKRDQPELASMPVKRDGTAFADRPALFVANLDGLSDYCVPEGVDAQYPEPGPDVDSTGSSLGPVTYCSSGADVPIDAAGGSSSGGSASGSSAAGGSATTATAAAGTTAAAETTAAATTSAASISGGVFITSPAGAESSTAAQQTTLTTKTASGAATTTKATTTKTASSAAAASSGASSAGAQSGTCTDDGAWACASDGASFQRCASGSWSAAIPMAAGTSCTPGISDTLSMARRNIGRRARRGYGASNYDQII
ncbi:hypothetical protein KJ359_011293 [Pestalotiopsis sp. 9143b]|nr:hypothetical protein KJ359_011293 [Pestalotiopsis sp. 9143b]